MSLVCLVHMGNYSDVIGKEKVMGNEKSIVNKVGDRKNYLWVLGIIVVIALLSRFDVTFELDTQTIALWRFNETERLLMDESENFHQGYIIGTSPIEGLFDQSRFFDGAKDYIIIPNTTALNPVKQFTIELWIYPMPSGASEGAIFCKGWGNGGESYCLDLVKSEGRSYRFRFFIRGNSAVAAVMSDPIDFNNWYYLACVYNGSSIEIYVNGALSKSISALFRIKTNSHDISIGARKPSEAAPYRLFFRGIIEEIRLSNRARPQVEIHNYYKRHRLGITKGSYPYYFWGIIAFCAMVILFAINNLKRWLYK